MITDRLSNCALYEGVHKDFKRVFAVLRRIAAGEETGEVVLEENCVSVSAPSEPKLPEGERVFEAHRDFIDIHFILSGAETFGYANVERLTTTKAYEKEGDYELLDGERSLVLLKAGDFCITFPQDAHIPFFRKHGEEKLVRVVAKIRA